MTDGRKLSTGIRLTEKKSGVKSYSIYRLADDPDYVIIHLVFDDPADASAALASLRRLWNKVEGTVMVSPHTRIMEMVEVREYQHQ